MLRPLSTASRFGPSPLPQAKALSFFASACLFVSNIDDNKFQVEQPFIGVPLWDKKQKAIFWVNLLNVLIVNDVDLREINQQGGAELLIKIKTLFHHPRLQRYETTCHLTTPKSTDFVL